MGCTDDIFISKGRLMEFPKDATGEITLPQGVEVIFEMALKGCSKIETLTIPDGVTEFYYSSFWDCTSLKTLNIPKSVTTIHGGNLYCPQLREINIDVENPNYIAKDGLICTKDGKQLIIAAEKEFYNIPEGVEYIGEKVFLRHYNLKNIVLPDSVIAIEENAFGACESLQTIKFSNQLTTIGDYAFSGCKKLTNIYIPSTVTHIGNRAFSWCTALNSIEYSGKLGYMGREVFYGCNNLTKDMINQVGTITTTKIKHFTYINTLIAQSDKMQTDIDNQLRQSAQISFLNLLSTLNQLIQANLIQKLIYVKYPALMFALKEIGIDIKSKGFSQQSYSNYCKRFEGTLYEKQ